MFPWIFIWAPHYNFKPTIDSSHESFLNQELQKAVETIQFLKTDVHRQASESTNRLIDLHTKINRLEEALAKK
jgi:hypothetical protein